MGVFFFDRDKMKIQVRVCDGICLKVGFCQSERKIKKITEMKGCGTSFMGLEGLLGDYIEGVYLDHKTEINNLGSIRPTVMVFG